MPPGNAGFQPGLAGMTEIAVFNRPGDVTVVAGTAEFAVDDFLHGHIIGAHAHFEAQFVMAHPALKADTVEPVRIDYGPNAFLLRAPVEYDICIFRLCQSVYDQYQWQQQHNRKQPGIANVGWKDFTQNMPAILALPLRSKEPSDSDCILLTGMKRHHGIHHSIHHPVSCSWSQALHLLSI